MNMYCYMKKYIQEHTKNEKLNIYMLNLLLL